MAIGGLLTRAGLLGAAGLPGAAGLLAGVAAAGAAGRAGGMAGLAAIDGAAGALVGVAGRGLAAGLGAVGAAAAAGLEASAASLPAFLTERMAFGGALGAAATERPPLLPASIRERIRDASSSLIELLWLLAATPSFSAASSTSLLSRPRSRDSS